MLATRPGARFGWRGWPGASLRLFLCIACLLARECKGKPHSDVVVLTDENFDQKTSEGTWFVEIFAPWCSHCRKIEDVWQDLATRLKKEGIKVGKIDGTRENMLTSRFEIQGYPSFFHLTQGECRQYEGGRTEEEFYEFATSGWKKKEPWPFYRAPNSPIGRSLGSVKRWFFSMPSHLQQGYRLLHSEMGLSELWILIIALSIPVTIGLSCICALDYVNTRHALVPDSDVARPHED